MMGVISNGTLCRAPMEGIMSEEEVKWMPVGMVVVVPGARVRVVGDGMNLWNVGDCMDGARTDRSVDGLLRHAVTG